MSQLHRLLLGLFLVSSAGCAVYSEPRHPHYHGRSREHVIVRERVVVHEDHGHRHH
jgi:hypothetical protein